MKCRALAIALVGVLCVIGLSGSPAGVISASPWSGAGVLEAGGRSPAGSARGAGEIMQYSVTLTANQTVNLPFNAQTVIISNPTGSGAYVRVGGNDIPLQSNADIYAPPYSYIAQPINPTSHFALAITASTVGPTSSAAPAIAVTFSESSMPFQIANINNPNVAFQPQWASVWTNLAANGSQVIVPSLTGLSIVVYQLTAVYDNPNNGAVQFYWHYGAYSQATTLWPVYLWNIVGGTGAYALKRDTDVISFQPNGFPLPVGSALSIHNGDLVNGNMPWAGALYAYK